MFPKSVTKKVFLCIYELSFFKQYIIDTILPKHNFLMKFESVFKLLSIKIFHFVHENNMNEQNNSVYAFFQREGSEGVSLSEK